MNLKNLFFMFVVITNLIYPAHANTSLKKYEEAFAWKETWAQINADNIAAHIKRLNKTKMSSLTPAARKNANRYLETYMLQKFDWESIGKDYFYSVFADCDTTVMDNVYRLKTDTLPMIIDRQQVMDAYQQCALDGAKKSTHMLDDHAAAYNEKFMKIISRYGYGYDNKNK